MSPREAIEERLRRALTDVADATHLSPDAWVEVERRTHRRRLPRVVLAVAAVLAVGLITTATVLLVGRGDDVEIATSGDRATACGVAPPADLTVTLDPGASRSQIDTVTERLARSPAVTDSSFQSQEEGARIFECVYADEPEQLAGAELAQMPPVFFVSVAPETEIGPLMRNLAAANGVIDVTPGKCSERVDIEVYMVVDPTAEQLATARTAIEAAPGVADLTDVSKEDAYREFACLFADQPDLVEATGPEALPPSFRVTLAPDADHRALIQQFEELDGVDAVVDTRYGVVEPIPDFEGREVDPSSPPVPMGT